MPQAVTSSTSDLQESRYSTRHSGPATVQSGANESL